MTCFYCDAALSKRHERDHFPVAVRHGGTDTVPTCINCHDLKDRLTLDHWPDQEWIAEAWQEAGPLGRILIAKVSDLLADHRKSVAS